VIPTGYRARASLATNVRGEFAQLGAIVKGTRPAAESKTQDYAVITIDSDVDDWQLRLEDLNATAQQLDIHVCEKRLKLGLAGGLRPELNILRLQLANASTMQI
jgi:hypothetical protein